MRTIHFFDLDNTLWNIECQAWVILKDNPKKYLLRLPYLELSNILTGVYKKEDNAINYNGNQYWISDEMIKKIFKNKEVNLDILGLSFIEFTNPEYFNKMKIFVDNIRHIFGEKCEFGIISGRYSVDNDQYLLIALKKELKKYGIEISKFYYLSKKFKNITDKISYDKMKVLLENLVGFHINDDHFVPIKQDFYNNVYFYDDEYQNINVAEDIQEQLDLYLSNTEDDVYNIIIDRIKLDKPKLHTNLISNNSLNRFKTNIIELREPLKYSIKIENYNGFINKKHR
jgi:hypothetical protein